MVYLPQTWLADQTRAKRRLDHIPSYYLTGVNNVPDFTKLLVHSETTSPFTVPFHGFSLMRLWSHFWLPFIAVLCEIRGIFHYSVKFLGLKPFTFS